MDNIENKDIKPETNQPITVAKGDKITAKSSYCKINIKARVYGYIEGRDPELDKLGNEVQELQAQYRNATSIELKTQLQQEIKKKNTTLTEKIIEVGKQNAKIIKQQEKIIKQKTKEIKKLKQQKITPTEPYPIVKIDFTTQKDLLPMFMNKGIFSNYEKLPFKDKILEDEKIRLGKETLTFEETRAILTKTKEYKTTGYVIRDYGNYVIGFTSKLYLDHLEKTEEEYQKRLNQPDLFETERNKYITSKLETIKLYKLAHRLAYVILGEVYTQQKIKDLIIPKTKIITALGFTTNDKQMYQEIENALDDLRWLDYIVWDYNFTNTKKTHTKEKGTMVGNFIYNLKSDDKDFTLSINDKFVGCVQHLITNETHTKKERKEIFDRAYSDYPMITLPLTKDYSTPAYLLTQFLIREKGNNKLNEKNDKIISFSIDRYIKEAHIQYSRLNEKYKAFLKTLSEIEIIEKIEPTMEKLKTIKPASKALKTNLKIWVTKDSKKLNEKMETIIENNKKSNILVAEI